MTARFLSPDPVGFAGGGPGYFNRYAYTMNDPVNYTDPTGEEAWLVSRPLGDSPGSVGLRHTFVVVAEELGGSVQARFSCGPSGPIYAPGNLVSLTGTGAPTDLDDRDAWASLSGGGAPGVGAARIEASDLAVIVAGEHVNAALGSLANPGQTAYLATTSNIADKSYANSNSAAFAVANAARIADGGGPGQHMPGPRATGHGQADHIPTNQEEVNRHYERRVVTGSRIPR